MQTWSDIDTSTFSAAESYSAGRLETKVGITNEEVKVLPWKTFFCLLEITYWYVREFLWVEV